MPETEPTPWHESDEFWLMRDGFMFGPDRWAAVPAEVDRIVGLLGLAPGAHVLDLCCGPGRHSLELARRGFTVTGVDRTTAYLDRSRSSTSAEGLKIEFVHEDMRTFRREAAFDAALNLFTSFGYFEDPKDDLAVVANLHSSLRPGGRLLMDMIGKEVVARRFAPRVWDEVDGVLMVVERSVDPDWTWIRNREIYIDGARRVEFQMDSRIYSGAELRAVLMEGGFAEVKLFGDLAGSAYDASARRLVALARK